MNATDFVEAGMRLIFAASPFVLVSMSIYYAGDLIALIRKAVASSKGW